MRDTYYGVHMQERGFQELVRKNACRVLESKKTMIRKHRLDAQQMCMENALVPER